MSEQPQRQPIRRALLSVADKTGIVELARDLVAHGVTLLSTGGTAHALREAGLEVTDVSDYTGFPEIMGGRVKTLHPRVHGALLARRDRDRAVMDAHGIQAIDLLVANLYPFERTVADEGHTLADAIENIDIGGPAMIRAAAKSYAAVTVAVDPGQYSALREAVAAGGADAATRYRFAVEAFAHTARYDAAVANYLSAGDTGGERSVWPAIFTRQWRRAAELRYGENPHQAAALYTDTDPPAGTIAAARQLAGKPLSYNNIADCEAALECVKWLDGGPGCVIVKHTNPCGAAVADSPAEAYARAHAGDPTSAFGGVIAFNRELDADTIERVLANQFVECLIAPAVTAAALDALSGKPNVRALAVGGETLTPTGGVELRSIGGGLLAQTRDTRALAQNELRVVTERAPSAAEHADLVFAWALARAVKSNAIVYAANGRSLGIGAGQMSRVDSARIGAWKAADAGLSLEGAAMASDAFFPFRDSIDEAATRGIRAVIQPGGSRRDDEVIAAANEHGMAMVLTGTRHFRH